MTLLCPTCRAELSLEDINVATDLALCRACENTFSFSSLIDAANPGGVDLSAPPGGAWYQSHGSGFRLGATTRSPIAFFLVPFTCVWAGGSLTGIYGSQIAKGHLDPFASLFGIPFGIGSLALMVMCAMHIAGKVELKRDGDTFSVFTGVGVIGLTRRYTWSDFSLAREGLNSGIWNASWNHSRPSISLEGKSKISFGNLWSEKRRYFVLNVLRSFLRPKAR